jgi:4-amino-4-deoxy-L-arabinose transferase-like glycosyltransferase
MKTILYTKNIVAKVLLLLLLTVFLRIPSLVSPNAIDDERIYTVVAHEMLEGGQMYRDAIERKPPLLFWTYEAIYAVGGKYNHYFLHITALVWVLLTMLALYKISCRLFDENTGFVAAFLYALFGSWLFCSNLALNGEVLMNLPIFWAIYLVFSYNSGFRIVRLLLAGALLACAFLLKQTAAIMAVPVGLYLLSEGFRKKSGTYFFFAFIHAFTFTLGFILILAIVVWQMMRQGLFVEAFDWTIQNHDIPHGPTDFIFWQRGIPMTLLFMTACSLLVVGTYFSSRLRKSADNNLWKGKTAEYYAFIGLVIASIIGISQPGRFYPHYFIQLVPVMCLTAAPVFAGIWTGSLKFENWLLRRSVVSIWFVVTILAFLCYQTFGLSKYWNKSPAGQYLFEHSKPTETVFIWGQATPLYLDAQRRPASRYIATYPLTGYMFGSPYSWDPNYDTADRIVPGAWEKLKIDFTERLPDYIIDSDVARKVPRYPIVDFPYLKNILDSCYTLEYKAMDGYVFKRTSETCAMVHAATGYQ